MTAPGPDIADAPSNLLVPEPAVRTGALIGYARVSTSGQLLDRQQNALAEAGCLRIFADKLSGKDAGSGPVPECDLRHSGWTGRAQTEPIRAGKPSHPTCRPPGPPRRPAAIEGIRHP